MAIPVGKTFIPLAVVLIRHACKYVVKHRQRIVEATAILDSTKVAAMNTAIDGIIAACAVFETVETILDPNN